MNKLILTLMASGVSLLALTNHAAADPVSIGSFILVNLLPGLIGTGIGPGLVGSLALGATALGVNVAVALASRQKIKPDEYKNTFSTGESSEIRAVGRVRTGGLKAFGNTKDYNRYRLVCHAKGPATLIETYYLGGREVTVEPNGQVSSPPWSYITPNGGGPGIHTTDSNVYINTAMGDGTETAWSGLTTDFPTQWTSAHRVRGICQSLVKYISPGISSDRFLKIFQSVPDLEVLLRADKVYDPRDVAQSVDTPSTWKWSENGILNAVHILRTYPNFTSADFDWTGISTQATNADATVATLTGTEVRARCWGIWPSENQRNDVMQQVLNSIGAEIVPGADDKILVRLIDDGPTPEIEYAAKHITDIELRYGPEAVERPNLCVVKYYSPERNYEMAEIDLAGIAWARVQGEIDRYGEKPYTVELPFCPSASQAQRIARRLFLTARADTGIVTLNQTGLAAWGLRYASFEFSDIGTEGVTVNQVCAIDVPRDNPDEPTVEIPFLVWPSLPSWNPATDEAPAPEILPELNQPSDLTTPNQPISACVVQYTDDSTYEIRLHSTTPAGGTYVEAVLRPWDAVGPLPPVSMTEVESAGTFDTAHRDLATSGVAVGGKVDFRKRIFDADGNASEWSDALVVAAIAIDNTAPTAPGFTVETFIFNPGFGEETRLRYKITPTSLTAVRATVEFTANSGGSWTAYATHSHIGLGLQSFDSAEQVAVGKGFRVTLYSSNGTAGATATAIYT